jgi:hypothetical protein
MKGITWYIWYNLIGNHPIGLLPIYNVHMAVQGTGLYEALQYIQVIVIGINQCCGTIDTSYVCSCTHVSTLSK